MLTCLSFFTVKLQRLINLNHVIILVTIFCVYLAAFMCSSDGPIPDREAVHPTLELLGDLTWKLQGGCVAFKQLVGSCLMFEP